MQSYSSSVQESKWSRKRAEEVDHTEQVKQTNYQTFLAVDDEVALLVSCGDLIRDPVTVRVLCQHRGNQRVGACVL